MKYINYNGAFFERNEIISSRDKALRYGYGLFETILVKNGVIMLSGYHWERLLHGMKQLDIHIPAHYSSQWLEEQVRKTITKNDMEDLCRVRLQVTAGEGGLYDREPQSSALIIECAAIEASITELNKTGLNIGTARGLAKSPDSIAGLKTCSALIYALAAKQAKVNGWSDALVKNTQGRIIESTIANLFLVKDEQVYTPMLSEGCIAGVMRKYIISSLAQRGILVKEKEIEEEEVRDADELFISNAIRRVKWVGGLEGKPYKNEYTKHLSEVLFRD